MDTLEILKDIEAKLVQIASQHSFTSLEGKALHAARLNVVDVIDSLEAKKAGR